MIDPNIPREWLTKKLVAGASNFFAESERDEEIAEIASGFINLRSEWEEVFGKIDPEDEIWEFDSPGDHWVSLCGRAGLALVRPGRPVKGIVTEMN
jgi:hypothetical protein